MNPIEAIGAAGLAPCGVDGFTPCHAVPAGQAAPGGFGELLMSGLRAADMRVGAAEQLVQQFAVDDSIPVHQVTIALEQARLSVDLAMQIRSRLVEGYRELMNMQL